MTAVKTPAAPPRGPDAGLRREFRARLVGWQWTSVESPLAAPGCPDSEYCAPGGASGWVEYKRTAAFAVTLRPLQVAWLQRRARLGGRCFVAVRRITAKGADELWLYPGGRVTELADSGLRTPGPLGVWPGGPAHWSWAEVGGVMTSAPTVGGSTWRG